MRAISIALRQAKNAQVLDEPFIVLVEIDKNGWWRLRYSTIAGVTFHEEAEVDCNARERARIVFVEPETPTTGSLIIEPTHVVTGRYLQGSGLLDSYGGHGVVAETLDLNASPGITFYLARSLEDITVFGQTYMAFPFIANQATQGQDLLPSLELTVGNQDRIVEAWLRKADGFIGCRARIKVIWAGDLA